MPPAFSKRGKMEYFSIGGLPVLWDSEGGLPLPPGGYIEGFRTTREALPAGPGVLFRSRYGDTMALAAAAEPVSEKLYTSLYRAPRGRMLVHHLGRYRAGMITYPDEFQPGENGWVTVECICHPGFASPGDPGTVVEAATVLGRAGLHMALQPFGTAVLHGSFIEWEGGAILFSAPSGVGKSTQAALWQKYAGATVVNGDRVLLRELDGRYYACGYPACGSSDVCLNEMLPIRAIVLLEQAGENEVTALSAGEKIRRLLTGMELYRWHEGELDRALRFCEGLVDALPVPLLRCRPDEGAVRALQSYLSCGGNENAD